MVAVELLQCRGRVIDLPCRELAGMADVESGQHRMVAHELAANLRQYVRRPGLRVEVQAEFLNGQLASVVEIQSAKRGRGVADLPWRERQIVIGVEDEQDGHRCEIGLCELEPRIDGVWSYLDRGVEVAPGHGIPVDVQDADPGKRSADEKRPRHAAAFTDQE